MVFCFGNHFLFKSIFAGCDTFHADGIMKIHKYLSVEMATSVKTDAHTDIIEMKLHTLQ